MNKDNNNINDLFRKAINRRLGPYSRDLGHDHDGYVVLSAEHLGHGRHGVDLGWKTHDIAYQDSEEKSIVLKHSKDIDGRDHRLTQRKPGDPSWGFMTSDDEDFARDDIWFYIEPEHWDKFYKQYDNLFNITDYIENYKVSLSTDKNLSSIILK